jgi:hypothetical protein
LTAVLIAGCSSGAAPKPDLPVSVSPGWSLRGMVVSEPPAGLPQLGTPPVCWKADYAGEGDATVRVCGYRVSAFEAEQRMPFSANQVKFHKGVYLVIVQWNDASQASITALVGAIQRNLPER